MDGFVPNPICSEDEANLPAFGETPFNVDNLSPQASYSE